MPLHRCFLVVVLVGPTLLFTLACSIAPQRRALSVAVSPSAAIAPSNGQVQFTATGTYNTSPTTLSPLTANWAVVDSAGAPTTAVTVTSDGLAQCGLGTSGVFTVGAWVLEFSKPPSATCNAITGFGNPCNDSVLGTAQLTCP